MKKLSFFSIKSPILFFLFLYGFSAFAQSSESLREENVSEWYTRGEWLNGLTLSPHPSIDQQEFAKQYRANKIWWDKAFEFLRTNDLANLKPGSYLIDSGNVFASVSEVPAIDPEQIRWESHRNFNDIQCIISGKVQMGVSPIAMAKVAEAYDSKKDLALYDTEGSYYFAEPGTFFIFSPKDVHRPGIRVQENEMVKKIIIKVRAGK